MAKKTQPFDWKKFVADRNQAFTSGILALILIILAFLAANTLSETSKSTNDNKKEQSEKQTQTKEKNISKTPDAKIGTNQSSTNYTVVKGDNLWKIAVKYYNDGYRWTQIASENKIANPDKIEKGQVLTISNTSVVKKTIAENNDSQTFRVTYTVHKGDSLWSISQKFYNGNGYNWVLIRDANQNKVSLLPNGRPRIEPNTVLTIPQLQ